MYPESIATCKITEKAIVVQMWNGGKAGKFRTNYLKPASDAAVIGTGDSWVEFLISWLYLADIFCVFSKIQKKKKTKKLKVIFSQLREGKWQSAWKCT